MVSFECLLALPATGTMPSQKKRFHSGLGCGLFFCCLGTVKRKEGGEEILQRNKSRQELSCMHSKCCSPSRSLLLESEKKGQRLTRTWHLRCTEYLSSLHLLTPPISVTQMLSFPFCRWEMRLINLPNTMTTMMIAVNIYVPDMMLSPSHILTDLILTITL